MKLNDYKVQEEVAKLESDSAKENKKSPSSSATAISSKIIHIYNYIIIYTYIYTSILYRKDAK